MDSELLELLKWIIAEEDKRKREKRKEKRKEKEYEELDWLYERINEDDEEQY